VRRLRPWWQERETEVRDEPAEPKSSVRFGYAREEDLPDIYDIETRSFSPHWSYNSLAQEVCHPREYSHVLAGKLNGRVVCFTVFWTVVDECHVLNFAVHPDYRRQGIGAAMMDAVLRRMKSLDIRVVTLEVRISNLTARRLYERAGFKPVAIRRGFYQDNGEDAIVMWRDKGMA